MQLDLRDRRAALVVVDVMAELAPGVAAIAPYGHTVGHQSFVVDLPDGDGFVFAFDAADLQQNLDDEIAPGSTPAGQAEMGRAGPTAPGRYLDPSERARIGSEA